MKAQILWILGIGCLALSCEKEPLQPLKDQISFTELVPNLEGHTIREYYTVFNPYCPPLPLPNDSSVSFQIDLNNDSAADFEIIVSHQEQEVTDWAGHCGIFHLKLIKITPLNANGSISVDPVSNYWVKNYEAAQAIDPADRWSSETVTGLIEGGVPLTPRVVFEETYWGLKLGDQVAWIQLERTSKNGLKIKAFAVNETKGNSIKAGQTE